MNCPHGCAPHPTIPCGACVRGEGAPGCRACRETDGGVCSKHDVAALAIAIVRRMAFCTHRFTTPDGAWCADCGASNTLGPWDEPLLVREAKGLLR